MQDRKPLDISAAIMWTIVAINPCIVFMNLMMSREKSIKSIREEVIIMGVHETSYKESIDVINIKDIKIVEQGRSRS